MQKSCLYLAIQNASKTAVRMPTERHNDGESELTGTIIMFSNAKQSKAFSGLHKHCTAYFVIILLLLTAAIEF